MDLAKNDTMPLPGRFDDEGMRFLDSRYLDAGKAQEMRISAYHGSVYFPFHENGKIVAWKKRNIADKSRQSTMYVEPQEEEKKGVRNAKSKLPFFNMFTPEDTKYLIITEGEFDCVALAQLGAANVVSLPNGASNIEKVFRTHFKFLQKFETIYIAFDTDAPGEKAAKEAMEFIPFEKYRRIRFPEDTEGQPYKDANDWLIGRPNVTMHDLAQLMIRAEKIESKSITHFSELDDSAFDAIELGCSTGFKDLDRVLGGLRKGEVTLLSSETGSGKTTFALNLAVNLANQKKKVWINSFENKHHLIRRDVVGMVLKKKIGTYAISKEDQLKYKTWELQHDLYLNHVDKAMHLDKLTKEFEFACLGHKIDYIILDHLDFLYSKEAANAWALLEKTILTIHHLAEKYKVGVILIAHPKQIPGPVREITFNDFKGGSCIRQLVDSIIILTRKDLINVEEKNKTIVSVVKNRQLGILARFDLKFDPQSKIFSDFEEEAKPSFKQYKDDDDQELDFNTLMGG